MMIDFVRFALASTLLSTVWASDRESRESTEAFTFPKPTTIHAGSLHNVHLDYQDPSFEGQVRIVHGKCDIRGAHEAHHEISSTYIKGDRRPDRLVWIVPEDVVHHGCLHAFSGSQIVAKSDPIRAETKLRKRQSIADVADIEGPWFEGVAYLKNKTLDPTTVAEAKSKRIAIVGAGMSGLMTGLLLDSVGMTNWHITESSQRVGGRVRTKYLANSRPEDYQYQEMGPMRFPVSVKYAGTNETIDIQDQKMVFQLADTLNKLNAGRNRTDLKIRFIPWIESNPNAPADSRGGRLPNGQIPSAAQLQADESLAGPAPTIPDSAAVSAASSALDAFLDLSPDRIAKIAGNVYKAHKEAVDRGLLSYSEAAYLKYALNQTTDVTDFLTFVAGAGSSDLWANWYENVYFAATTWRTIDKGLEMLPRAFVPLIGERITYGRKIQGLTYQASNSSSSSTTTTTTTTSRIALTWRDDPFRQDPESETYDYAVVAVPFTRVRLWRVPPFSSLLTRAIRTLNYDPACKVALHYRTRFWEHFDDDDGRVPIFGGCGATDIPAHGAICYPPYALNASGPGVLLAAYAYGPPARSLAALPERDHVALAQRAVVEAHGEVAAREFTDHYERQCWDLDEHQAGAWASPDTGRQALYLPAYFRTEFRTIFVGEHTSHTNTWIFSALDSAVRGTVQLLLDLGLVDEAKQIVQEWMARWIDI